MVYEHTLQPSTNGRWIHYFYYFFFFFFFPKCRNTGIGVNKCEAAGVITDALYVGIMYVCMQVGREMSR